MYNFLIDLNSSVGVEQNPKYHKYDVLEHTFRTVEFAPKKIRVAALLHDADDHKLFKTENNANARAFLEESGVPDETTDTICAIINSVSFSKNRGKIPDSIEGKIVQDADRLDAIGAVGIARTFMYGGSHGRSIEETREHFEDKLLLLKDKMNTDTAKKIASVRHEYLLSFLEELDSELS